ncbi:hypothetical protein [Streptomyces jeddahensis]|uniref:hypothetical protein n=1 Tax=Streptomyces jeddahensis TaxID=1716141 RepID=UPI0008359870|nr:hypothetical protein [Streptomyces jeddahensis]
MPTTARTTRKTTASRATPRKKAEATRVEEKTPARTERAERAERAEETHVHEGPGGMTVHTHTFHPPMPVAYLTRQDLAHTARAATSMLPRPGRPQAKDVAFYGGLGALTVAGALEWPVAVAVGGATWLLRSKGKEGRREAMESREASGSRTVRPAGRAV